MNSRLLRCSLAVLALLLASAAVVSWADEQANQRLADRADADANTLISASSDQRLWLVRPPLASGRDGDRPRLLHHSVDMDGPHFSRGPSLLRMPEALAASGDRVWIVFPPQEIRGELRREVYTIRMVRDAAMGLYQPEPRDRMTLAQDLPGWGRLAGFAAGGGQPAALIVPLDHETFSVRRDGKDAATEMRSPQLWQMRSDRWEQVDLPQSPVLLPADPVAMALDGPNRSRLNVLTGAAEGGSVHMRLEQDGDWDVTPINIDARAVRAITATGERLAVVTAAEDTATLAYVREGRVLSLAQFEPPNGKWTVAGLRDGFRLVAHTGEGELEMRQIGGVTGSLDEALAMTDQPLPAGKLWHTGLMLAVSVIAVLIVLLVRPKPRSAVEMPKHTGILPAVPRLVALLIDLVPGAVLAMLIMRAAPPDLLRIPMMAETLGEAGPHLLMLGITFLHCTIVEMLTGTTLGKMLVGAEVASANGARPGPVQVLIRNGVKLMVLIVPPLAVFALLNPHMQGFNDMAAGTVVLREDEEHAQENEAER